MFENAVEHFIDVKHPDVQKNIKGKQYRLCCGSCTNCLDFQKISERELSLENKHNKLWKKVLQQIMKYLFLFRKQPDKVIKPTSIV